MKNKSKGLFVVSLLFFALTLNQCGGSGSSSNGSSSTIFPSDLAITSPTKLSASASGDISMSPAKVATSYEVEVAVISAILSATSLANCSANFDNLLTLGVITNCYGPEVEYVNHPDGAVPNGDTLPPGDVGIWTENEGATTEACAAAELNSRMEGVKDKTTAALAALASMICTINNTASLSLPAVGSSVTMTTEFNAMLAAAGVATVTANSATLALASNVVGTTDYTYSLNLTLTAPASTDLQIDMTHRPLDSANTTYTGRFSYYFNSSDPIGNCSSEYGALSTTDITELGSTVYEKSASTSLAYDSRYAQSCGHGNTAPLVSNVLDPTVKSTTANPGPPDLAGWSGNFTKLVSSFDPSTNIGNYAFIWQAGVGDAAVRAFNVNLEDDDADGILSGAAFFGFGADVATSDGSITGMYCNWAGPNGGSGGHDPALELVLAQKQTINEDVVNNIFTVGTSEITYAPTNDCDSTLADVAAGFQYDQNGDGTVDPATVVTNNLIDPNDATNGIAASGFSLPTAPAGP